MKALTVTAYAKVNLTLFITGQRADGYHLLDMVMHNISLSDRLLLEEAENLSLVGDTAGAAGMDNLALQAADLLAREVGIRAGCHITLKKGIPSQAGLGGGSADAAAVLMGLDRLWNLKLGPTGLTEMALKLGADVPFFLVGGTARAQGIGEILTPVRDFPRLELVLVKPREGLPTPRVFREWHRLGRWQADRTEAFLTAMAAGDLETGAQLMGNDLEETAMALCPGVQRALEAQQAAGALRAMMTGSGTAVLGWYRDAPSAARAETALRAAGWRVYHVHSIGRAMEICDGEHA